MILILFAFLSGIITILSPCILPLLPVVLAGNVAGGRGRPYGVVTGFAVSFTGFTLGLSALVAATGVSADALRVAAVVILLLFGVVLIVPALKDRFQLIVSRLVARSSVPAKAAPLPPGESASAGNARSGGYWGGVLVGVSLGLVWTPCVGPIMASVISLAVSHAVNAGSVFITLAYSIGTAIPMFAIMVGGRALLRRVPWLMTRSAQIQRIFGVLMVAVAVVVAFGWDRTLETSLLTAAPGYGAGLTSIENTQVVRQAIVARDSASGAGGTMASNASDAASGSAPALSSYGPAPALVADGKWFNSPPLTMKDLRGKVVLVDFWTYSCINCIRTLPYLRSWYQKYKDDGFVIIGVHSPEFAFEHNPANVAKAIRELDVTWPVVQDNDFREWDAYKNMYWPADYFIDAKGDLRYFHFGEGDYVRSEAVIRELLTKAGHPPTAPASLAVSQVSFAGTPETYLGAARAAGFAGKPAVQPGDGVVFSAPKRLAPNDWDLTGTWNVRDQYIAPVGTGTLRLSFDAKQVYLVIQVPRSSAGGAMKESQVSDTASDPALLTVTVDGKTGLDTPDVRGGVLRPTESRMYHIVTLPAEGRHLLTITAKGNIRLFSFTFGG